MYADGGVEDKSLDAGALDVLVLATGSWLEVNALRKQAQKDPTAVHAEAHESAAKAPASTPAFNDPFASHTPAYAMAAAASGQAARSATADPNAVHQ